MLSGEQEYRSCREQPLLLRRYSREMWVPCLSDCCGSERLRTVPAPHGGGCRGTALGLKPGVTSLSSCVFAAVHSRRREYPLGLHSFGGRLRTSSSNHIPMKQPKVLLGNAGTLAGNRLIKATFTQKDKKKTENMAGHRRMEHGWTSGDTCSVSLVLEEHSNRCTS